MHYSFPLQGSGSDRSCANPGAYAVHAAEIAVSFCPGLRLQADSQTLAAAVRHSNILTYLNCRCLASSASSVGLANITERSWLIDEVPGKDCRLVLVHPVGDGVDTVGHGFLVVLVQGDDFWIGVELFWVLSTSPEDITIQAIICPPVVSKCQDDLGTSLVCISYDLVQSLEGLFVVLTCEQRTRPQWPYIARCKS